MDEQFLARRNLKELPDKIDRLSQRLDGLTADQATMDTHANAPMTISGRRVLQDDTLGVLGNVLEAIPQHVNATRRFALGTYHGLAFGIIRHPQWHPEIYLEGKVTRLGDLSDHQGPRAVLNALERIARGYRVESERTQQDLQIASSQLHDYQARAGQPFAHDAYLKQLADLRDQLKTGLSGAEPKEGQPTVAELAEQIKALKSAHTIEATPERVTKRRSTAEEPVTARIRRRAEALPSPALEPDLADKPSETSPPTNPDHIAIHELPSHDTSSTRRWSSTQETAYQEYAARGR